MDISAPHADVKLDELQSGINIYHLDVDYEHRREGIGSQVLQEVENMAREHDKEYVVVNMAGGDSAETFLKENGYTIVERVDQNVTAEKEV